MAKYVFNVLELLHGEVYNKLKAISRIKSIKPIAPCVFEVDVDLSTAELDSIKLALSNMPVASKLE